MNPEIVIQNIGGKVLTSLEINWSVNNEAVRNFVWSGSLDFLSKESIVLPITGFTPAPQHNALKISIRNPNGINDANTANDSLVTYFDAAGNTGLPLKLELRTDQFPSEVSWKIVNSSGIVSLSGDHYNAPNSIFTQNIDLPADECYTFIIDDRGGDGICCKYGNGSYKLLNSQGVEIATGGNFGNTESVPFKVSAKEGLSELEMVTDFQVFPNPFDNNATISIFISREMNVKVRVSNEMGQIVFSQDSEALPAGSHTYELNGENWAPGIYVVKVVTDGKLLTRKLTLTK